MPALTTVLQVTNWVAKNDFEWLQQEMQRIPSSWIEHKDHENGDRSPRRFFRLFRHVPPGFLLPEINDSCRKRVIFCEADCKKWQCAHYKYNRRSVWNFNVCVAGCDGIPITGYDD